MTLNTIKTVKYTRSNIVKSIIDTIPERSINIVKKMLKNKIELTLNFVQKTAGINMGQTMDPIEYLDFKDALLITSLIFIDMDSGNWRTGDRHYFSTINMSENEFNSYNTINKFKL